MNYLTEQMRKYASKNDIRPVVTSIQISTNPNPIRIKQQEIGRSTRKVEKTPIIYDIMEEK